MILIEIMNLFMKNFEINSELHDQLKLIHSFHNELKKIRKEMGIDSYFELYNELISELKN